MITAVMIAVVSGIGYVSFSNSIENQTAKTGIGQVAYAVRKAKHYARTKGTATTLSLTVGSNNFDMLANGQSLTDTNNFDASSGNFPDDIEVISSSCGYIGFSVDGTLVDSAGNIIYNDCTITVGYSNGPQETITVKGKTGIVEYDS